MMKETIISSEKTRDAAEDVYFNELLGAGVDRLTREPELLKAEQEQLARQIEETVVANYKAFIKASSCLKGLRVDLNAVNASLQKLEEALPTLQKAIMAFRKEGATLASHREALRTLYENYPVLLDLLEIPSLMETCIRAGNFDEALDLKSFSVKLAVGHGDLPIIQRLLNDIDTAANAMLESLLQRISGPIQLPECLRVIGYLRRLSAFTESGLREAFLQHREFWIASMLEEIDDSSPYDFVKKVTDIYRSHLFDVVMHYKAIFVDGDEDLILSFWIHRRIGVYIRILELYLPRISEGASLSSILDTAMYCAASLGRVGLDFRSAIVPHFEVAAARLFKMSVELSTESFEDLLQGHKWIILPSTAGRIASLQRQQQEQLRKEETDASRDDSNESKPMSILNITSLPPPLSLIEHAPLAVYLNGLLSAFNEIRHCAPTAIMKTCAHILMTSITRAADALATQNSSKSFTEEEKKAYNDACKAFISVLCPFVEQCFDTIFKDRESTTLDFSKAERVLHEVQTTE